jgi:hypothetical protein
MFEMEGIYPKYDAAFTVMMPWSNFMHSGSKCPEL